MKKSTKGIVIGVIAFGLLTTGAIGVYKHNKEEQKKEIRAELKELKHKHKKEELTYEVYVAEYNLIEALIDVGESDTSQLLEVENKRVEQFDKVHGIYSEIEKLEKQLKE